MAENNSNGSNTFLAFMVGVLLVLVIGGAALYSYNQGYWGGSTSSKMSVDVDTSSGGTPDVDVTTSGN